MSKNLYYIPAGIPFAKTLGQELLKKTAKNPADLPNYLILLPTRRACHILQETFLQLNKGAPLLLPRINPLGDVEEEELSIHLSVQENTHELTAIPPAIPSLKRRLLLAALIGKMKPYAHSIDQSLALADALTKLMDQIYIEGLDFSALENIVPEEFSDHWRITTDFLKILSESWPKILQEQGFIDAADRRNRLIRTLARHWRTYPPKHPVIAAGSTGSIPATAELLTTVAALPQGQVILPGLDTEMDEESWNAISETHPQHGLKKLLDRMNADRAHVRSWIKDTKTAGLRRLLAREIMRPAETTIHWTNLNVSPMQKNTIQQALGNLSLLECANEHEEAQVIALLLRETLETPEKTAVLITPDRTLARRVITACRAWDITLDDSAGTTLDQMPIGIFLRLILEVCLADYAPIALLSLLKHPFFCPNLQSEELISQISFIDEKLRGLKPAPGLIGLYRRLGHENPLLEIIAPHFEEISKDRKASFTEFLTWHLATAENFAGKEILWRREDGESAAKLLAELQQDTSFLPFLNLADYAALLERFLKSITVRPVYGTHPRLKILGQLEARLVQADLTILGGLNEGAWPPDLGYDPWMSRPMRQDFGLPAPERDIALAAHDFVQAFCSGEVVLTRAARQNNARAVPARWLQRLEAVLEAANVPKDTLCHSSPVHWARQMHKASDFRPTTRPAPAPPAAARPRRLPITKIKTWLRDPYSIYARYILDLKKQEPLEKEIDAAERGMVLHNVLKSFVLSYPDSLPGNAENVLIQLAKKELEIYHEDPAVWTFWQPRFERLAAKFVELETAWRAKGKPLACEIRGEIAIQSEAAPFIITATADRIDRIQGGGAIIDYKSGGPYSKKSIKTGEQPQLALEALMLEQGGFENIKALKTLSLSYWKLSGGIVAGEIIEVNDDLPTIIERTRAGLQNLINLFDRESTPYLNIPHADRLPQFNDYEHLARIREWSILGESEDFVEAA